MLEVGWWGDLSKNILKQGVGKGKNFNHTPGSFSFYGKKFKSFIPHRVIRA